MSHKIKPIAIYLPQFHPIPENDRWWGKGFTEWTNVTKAKPKYKGHYQPHLPADLGFYDLRLEEARLAQEQLAKDYGVHGFCYYHYWFNGKRILYEPLDRKLKNSKEDLPFMMCWANENWTRAWDGGIKDVLLEQNYSEDDDRQHISFLLSFFKDERYIRVNDKPFFIFYKPDLFPNMARTIAIFREEALRENLELYLGCFERWNGWKKEKMDEFDFDAIIEFQPLSNSMCEFKKLLEKRKILKRIQNKFRKKLKLEPKIILADLRVNYKEFINFDIQNVNKGVYPGVTPMWDNSSRRVGQNATMLVNSSPDLFKFWYQNKTKVKNFEGLDENFIFINAWNEWAEGNHLEPCQKWGTKYLEALL
ncbi:glycoside hydrolase family 99-like domain-containing protein [Flavobacterium piscis]|uniref:Lipopolysaccharide biosynthesis protein n=1 Tax=Flavobacterium piscis TaxID=1114874 RepID=A0ABU1Y601_9FLAO|nr:glycoside hydrolase family 99-like domain-containing protein [Flavobacterium piscis]MDR7208961.1 lipopolysaccharide biosynthesis protein [Flavobacterium piscis]